DPFAIHRQHMNRMLSGSFGFGPLLGITDGSSPGARQAGRRMQAGAVSPFGMLGMAGGFIDMFGMMNDMIGNMEHMTSGANCQTFTSSTVISYSNLGDGPKVYQETSEMRSAPGGIRETRRTVRDSDSGLEQMITSTWMRVSSAPVLFPAQPGAAPPPAARLSSCRARAGDAAAFDDEWRRETSRFRPQRGLEYRRHEGGGRRAEGTRLAIQGPEDSPSRQSRRYDW
ncbi:MLF2 factor, partial [Climacteris rufus]|nr:MLF2 factor [Climacteris rufus]